MKIKIYIRVYKYEKREISSTLKKILLYDNLYTENKLVTFEALEIYADKNIDFADAMLCAKKNLGLKVIVLTFGVEYRFTPHSLPKHY